MSQKIPDVKLIANYVIIGMCSAFILAIGCGSCFGVKAGEVGVTFNRLTGTTESHSQGTYFKIPIVTDVTSFDVKTIKLDVLPAEAASKDLQKVHVHVVLNYHLDYTKVNTLYVKVGQDYQEKVIVPAVNETVKATTAQFPVEQIIIEREKVKNNIEQLLKGRLKDYDIILESVNLVNIDFDPDFNRVVEEKQIEEQKIKTAEYRKRQEEENAKRVVITAEAKARENQLMSGSTTKTVLALEWIKAWASGGAKMPVYMDGVSAQKMLMIPDLNKVQTE
jgi:regulator of protease activity HflC (stomatin/prohibitin superfamily)